MSLMTRLFRSPEQQEEIRRRAALKAEAEKKSREFRAASERLRATCEVGNAAEEARKIVEDADRALVDKGLKPRKEE